jgi:hypothetical protein
VASDLGAGESESAMSDLKIIGRLMGTVLIIGVTALLWLFLL